MFDPIVRFFLTAQLQGQQAAAKIRNQEGASAVEYGLLVGLIAVAIVVAVKTLGGTLSGLFDSINTQI